MLPPLAAGIAGAPAAFPRGGVVVVVVMAGGVVAVGMLFAGAPGVLGFAGVGFVVVEIGVVAGDPAVVPITGLAPLAPAPAAALVLVAVAARGDISLGELVSALHAQRLRAPIHKHMDEIVLLLDFMFISLLQCVGRFVRLASLTQAPTPPGLTSSVRSTSVGALSH